ncbi:hydrogenase formation protein HypD [Clostridium thermarum]|uniref:hydrogenase formation protein HypD n=1 Tax=Clostridium thermarum TaxID=1716543 RepID=UPI00111DACD3|nr:hydrogenase formation protein HypD [Clostridium thermarum]
MDIQELKRKIEFINSYKERVNIMEVCGTHTMAIGKHGIRGLLASNINLLSGPGCPVCVTPDHYIDYIYDLAVNKNCLIATYGDMIRVPGTERHISLEKAKALGAEVRMVYSSLDAVKLAKENLEKRVVFLGIGFETTTPATAIAVMEAQKLGLDNFYILSMHKKIEPVMRLLLEDEELKIDAFLCPGHVAVIIGEDGFKFLEEYDCAASIAGFELDEVINGLYSLILDLKSNSTTIKNVYSAVVRKEGNKAAQSIIEKYFCAEHDYWRGLGLVKDSGFKLKREYSKYNIEEVFPIDHSNPEKRKNGCQCGEVLKGKIAPDQCKLFGRVCSPESPVGPCMVSGEGSCAARYKFGNY